MTALSALLVDPALFTAPYDLALTEGLEAAGVEVRWASRPPRQGDDETLGPERTDAIYYRGLEESAKGRGPVRKFRKALSHLEGGRRLLGLASRGRCDVVHLQWAVLPLYDALVMRRLARRRPVILTVHDLTPFNGSPTSRLQVMGFNRALASATRLIVHTQAARETLLAQGYAPQRVVQIAHGPLRMPPPPPRAPRGETDRWRVVLFGKLQGYKGADLLVEALGRMPPRTRSRLHVVIAGEPLTEVGPLLERVKVLGLDDVVECRFRRLDDHEMSELLGSADTFVFPYRHIEASGVLHLVLPLQRWIVASDLGAFRELVREGVNGVRTPVGDVDSLAAALTDSIGRQPDPAEPVDAVGWDEIGRRTRAVYEEALAEQRSRR